ncbi:MAG: selenide, water dikinase SelD [Proteobacteria bacterium]|nr:selenide, water dikinase SelD [Pseudomonadota bacterium]MBU1717108.1 selenide, water dikinase SelD [Pseudomonadota bacterium]
MGPTDLSDALAGLTPPNDANLLVGIETADDAAVYRLSPEIAMINTVDFITPPVDDPYWFGQISAANSISDVYSMGGKPLTALNVVMFPSKQLDMGILKDILRGGHDKVVEAGACLVGGHTVDDEEPKYGLCVNGVVHPDRIITNAGSKTGDVLILTKPLGSGVLFNAVRSGKMDFKELERTVLPSLAALNGAAIEAALKFDLHACTDITGFGILGHLLEVAHGSNAHVVLSYKDLPFYPGALEMYKKGETTGSNKANRAMVAKHKLEMAVSLSSHQDELLYDPQTSGGLLLSLPADQAADLIAQLKKIGTGIAARIGEIVDQPVGITVV